MDVNCIVDTGSNFLCIREHVAFQLNLKVLEIREVKIADGYKRSCNYVEPVKVSFDNRMFFSGTIISGQEIILGSIPVSDINSKKIKIPSYNLA